MSALKHVSCYLCEGAGVIEDDIGMVEAETGAAQTFTHRCPNPNCVDGMEAIAPEECLCCGADPSTCDCETQGQCVECDHCFNHCRCPSLDADAAYEEMYERAQGW